MFLQYTSYTLGQQSRVNRNCSGGLDYTFSFVPKKKHFARIPVHGIRYRERGFCGSNVSLAFRAVDTQIRK